MNRFFLCLLVLTSSFSAFSQKVYFIYLQSEQEQPFFVKMNEKIYSSSSSGYLILSKLPDSTYNFTIGFPQNKWPEQKFSVALKAKDHGYIVKDFGAKGWGLFDLQTLGIQMSSTEPVKTSSGKTESKDVSLFTEILAKAADDPSLRERPVIVKTEEVKTPEKALVQEKKEETKPVVTESIVKKEEPRPVVTEPAVTKEKSPPVVTEPPLVKKEEPKKEDKEPIAARSVETITPKTDAKEAVLTTHEISAPPVHTAVEKADKSGEDASSRVTIVSNEQKLVETGYKKAVVTRKFGKTTAEGIGLMFIDEYGEGLKDTIHILIPDPRPVGKSEEKKTATQEKGKKFLDIAMEKDSSILAQKEVKETKEEPRSVTVVTNPPAKSNCKELATETDFLKLRRNMAAETDDDDMVDEARKYFKNKCFTTLQLKNLGALFLDDLGKYKFFDLAYLFVSDKENFSSLQSELKNEYYVNRFKAMIK